MCAEDANIDQMTLQKVKFGIIFLSLLMFIKLLPQFIGGLVQERHNSIANALELTPFLH